MSSGQIIIVKNQIAMPLISVSHRFLVIEPIRKAILKYTKDNATEKNKKNINDVNGKATAKKNVSNPDTTKQKEIIVNKPVANPSHFPQRNIYAEIGYVDKSPLCPSSFSAAVENPPNNNVINGNKYKVMFIIVPVISVYPSEVALLVCKRRMTAVKKVNKIKKE